MERKLHYETVDRIAHVPDMRLKSIGQKLVALAAGVPPNAGRVSLLGRAHWLLSDG